MGHRDHLTGAATFFALKHAIERRAAEQLDVLCFDIRGMRATNDRYGHQTGDALILAAYRRLSAVLGHETVYLNRPVEFALLRPRHPDNAALAQRLAADAAGELTGPNGEGLPIAFRTRLLTGSEAAAALY